MNTRWLTGRVSEKRWPELLEGRIGERLFSCNPDGIGGLQAAVLKNADALHRLWQNPGIHDADSAPDCASLHPGYKYLKWRARDWPRLSWAIVHRSSSGNPCGCTWSSFQQERTNVRYVPPVTASRRSPLRPR